VDLPSVTAVRLTVAAVQHHPNITFHRPRELHHHQQQQQQDHQALLKAKYCPRVTAVSRTQINTKNPYDLDL